jgi:hypothetical protein
MSKKYIMKKVRFIKEKKERFWDKENIALCSSIFLGFIIVLIFLG